MAQLRRTAAEVAASARAVDALPKGDRTKLAAAGKRFEDAAASACATLRVYQNATTRYGTDEEYRLIDTLLGDLDRARARFGALAGVSFAQPSAKQRRVAEQALRAYAAAAARKKIAQWIKDERLAGILSSGGIRKLRQNLEKEVTRRILAAGTSLARQATGIALALDVPIQKQVRALADGAALKWLTRVAFKSTPAAFVVQLVGKRIVSFVRNQLQKALRDHKKVVARTERTVKGFENRRAELQRLIERADSASLASVRRSLARAQRALDATTYLESDLKKQGRTTLESLLQKARSLLIAKIRETRETFLLDSELARTDLRAVADVVCKVRGEIRDANRRLPKATPTPGGRGSCTVSLRTEKGKPGVTGTMTLTLKPNPAVENKRVQPFVTATVSGARGGTKLVPVLFKLWFHQKGSDATFLGIGDARGLDFNQDSASGRTTPDKIEGMFVNTTEEEVRRNSPFRVRLFVSAFDESGKGIWTELVGLCSLR